MQMQHFAFQTEVVGLYVKATAKSLVHEDTGPRSCSQAENPGPATFYDP